MQRIMLSLATAALGLTVVGTAQAGKPGNGSGGGSHHQPTQVRPISRPTGHSLPTVHGNGTNITNGTGLTKKFPTVPSHQIHKGTLTPKHVTTTHGHNFLVKHAVKHHFGYSFHGKHHSHWTYQCWSPHYGCNIYWCPHAHCYFYWCAPHGCYYPVSYCPTGVYAY